MKFVVTEPVGYASECPFSKLDGHQVAMGDGVVAFCKYACSLNNMHCPVGFDLEGCRDFSKCRYLVDIRNDEAFSTVARVIVDMLKLQMKELI